MTARYVVKVDNLYLDPKGRLVPDQAKAMVYEEALSYAGQTYLSARDWALLDAGHRRGTRLVRLRPRVKG